MPKGNIYKKRNAAMGKKEDPEKKDEPVVFKKTDMTLQMLQDRIKRQPDMFKKEFENQFGIFQGKLTEFKESPGKKDEHLEEYFKFMAHISAVYRGDLVTFLSNEYINLLQQYHSILNPVMRMAIVTGLKIMRGKDVVAPTVVIPVFFKLFRCEDKNLRKFLHSIIVSDLKNLNKTHKVQNINRKLQNFVYQMIQDPNESASRRSLNVMIELYKRKIWNDDKTVNVISEACLHSNPKIIVAASKFFLILDYDFDSDPESSDSEGGDKIALLTQRKGKKLKKQKEAKLDRAIEQEKRKQKRRNLVKFSTDFLPIDLIHDPQAFVEKLFSKLKKSNDKYEVKLYMLRLISRMIGRHKIQLLQFYPNLLRYLTSHNKDRIGEVLAMVIESCHELIPPETVRPVIETIINNFITDYCNNEHITVGLNSIREVLLRMPMALDEG
jgi:protein SDA1